MMMNRKPVVGDYQESCLKKKVDTNAHGRVTNNKFIQPKPASTWVSYIDYLRMLYVWKIENG